jgi:MFS family permease
MNSSVEIRKLWVLLMAAFVDMMGYAMVFPLLPFYAVRFGGSPQVIGWMVASFSIAQVAVSPLWGRFSDKWGRRPGLLIGLAGSALAFLIFGFANSLWLLFVSRVAQGASGGTTGIMQAYIGDSVPPEDRAKALGWLSAATSAGVMIGPAIGSLSNSRLGPEAPGVIAAGLCLINLIFAWRWLPESRPRDRAPSTEEVEVGTLAETVDPDAAQQRTGKSVSAMLWETLRYPRKETSELIWIYAVAMMAFSALTAVLGLFLMERFQMTEANIGYIFLFLGSISVVMRAGVLGRVVRAFGEVRVMRLGAILLAIGLIAYPLPERFSVLLLVMGLVPIGTALLFPSTTGLLSRRGGKDQLGQLMGVQQAFGSVSRIVGPLWAGALFQRVSPDAPFYAAGAVVVLAVILAGRLRPQPRG